MVDSSEAFQNSPAVAPPPFDSTPPLPDPDPPAPPKSRLPIKAILVCLLLFFVGLSGGIYITQNNLLAGLQSYITKSPGQPMPTTYLIPDAKPTDVTAGWKTYATIERSLEFKYPPDWSLAVVSDSANGLYLNLTPQYPIGQRRIVLNIAALDGQTASYKYKVCCDKAITKQFGANSFLSLGPISLEGMLDWSYIVGDEKKLVEFSLGVGTRDDPPPFPNPEDFQKFITETEVILSTFKFTDQGASLKTYKNETFGFEFQYPASLQIQDNSKDAKEGTIIIAFQGQGHPFGLTVEKLSLTTTENYLNIPKVSQKQMNGISWDILRFEPTGALSGGPHTYYQTKSSTYRYVVEYTDQNQAEIDQILSTFKFVN